jgi:hypothetical protein
MQDENAENNRFYARIPLFSMVKIRFHVFWRTDKKPEDTLYCTCASREPALCQIECLRRTGYCVFAESNSRTGFVILISM